MKTNKCALEICKSFHSSKNFLIWTIRKFSHQKFESFKNVKNLGKKLTKVTMKFFWH